MKKRLIALAIALIAVLSSSSAVYAGPIQDDPPPFQPPIQLSITVGF